MGHSLGTRLYLAQEYIEGRSLEEELCNHQFSESEIVGIAKEVLDILCHLQSLSPMVFHRDIKPANLMRRSDGKIILVDLGAARQEREVGGPG